MKTFKMGDRVKWESQAAGSSAVKIGEVIMVVPPGKVPEGIKGAGMARNHESYVVSASVELASGKMSRKRTYWPLPSKLELAP